MRLPEPDTREGILARNARVRGSFPFLAALLMVLLAGCLPLAGDGETADLLGDSGVAGSFVGEWYEESGIELLRVEAGPPPKVTLYHFRPFVVVSATAVEDQIRIRTQARKLNWDSVILFRRAGPDRVEMYNDFDRPIEHDAPLFVLTRNPSPAWLARHRARLAGRVFHNAYEKTIDWLAERF